MPPPEAGTAPERLALKLLISAVACVCVRAIGAPLDPVLLPRKVSAPIEGRSASTKARGVTAPEDPFGDART